MKIVFFSVVRGVEVEITASDFDGDESVGIGIGPEDVSAKTMEGDPFELTNEEADKLGIEATEIYYDQE